MSLSNLSTSTCVQQPVKSELKLTCQRFEPEVPMSPDDAHSAQNKNSHFGDEVSVGNGTERSAKLSVFAFDGVWRLFSERGLL